MAEEIKFDDLIIEGVIYKTTLTTKFRRRKGWKTPNLNQINSFIPGTVIKVLVKPDQKVKQGEILITLDAMKMHNHVLMPFDGEILKINVSPGDVVSKNVPLIEVKPR